MKNRPPTPGKGPTVAGHEIFGKNALTCSIQPRTWSINKEGNRIGPVTHRLPKGEDLAFTKCRSGALCNGICVSQGAL